MSKFTPFYTVGYGNRTINQFMGILQRDGRKILIDVRSKPKAWDEGFSGDHLVNHLPHYGMEYRWMPALGGRPKKLEFEAMLTPDRRLDYVKMRGQERFLRGIGELLQVYREFKHVVLLCSELDPATCHRAKLVGETLDLLGFEVVHVEADMSLGSHEDVMARAWKNDRALVSDRVYE